MRQKRFETDYVTKLKSHIDNNKSSYQAEVFPIDANEVVDMPDVEKPSGLLERLLQNPKDDIANAINVYESYSNISPLIASQESFWAYLSHCDLLKYIQRRWDIIMSDDISKDRIRLYFFGTNHNAIGRLWWNTFLTLDESRADKYELTRVLYKQTDITQNLSTSMPLFPNKNAIQAILEFYLEHPEVIGTATNNRNRFITQSLNRWGAVKNLAYFSKNDFKNEIARNMDAIMSITSQTDYTSVEWIQG